MTVQVAFRRVLVRGFRNIRELVFEPSPRLNVISGDNGHGKTSLIEALYVVATSRSFRAEKLRELVQEGSDQSVIRAEIVEDQLEREQRAVLTGARRSVLINGKRPETLSAYAVQTPVVVFHPGDLELSSGSAALRRTLLDRVGLFLDPGSADARSNYQKSQRERQRILEERGPRARELDAYEAVIAEHGVRLSEARSLAASRVIENLKPAFERIAAPGLALTAEYRPGGTTDAEEFRKALAERRPWDLRRRSATFGPHRDELELSIDGRSARRHASQGQQRLLALALKLAELSCVRDCRGAHPILLLDDVSSELDPGRTGAVYEFLKLSDDQVFVTTTRPDLFTTPELAVGRRADFRLERGVLVGGGPL